ncbi:MAG: hypothetical protein K6U02_01910 [Firmicutes bacterium]|nr:hypothetical protein [Bacillota bacterium]
MIADRMRAINTQRIKTPLLALGGLLLAYQVGEWILYETGPDLVLRSLVLLALVIALVVLANWRYGLYLFLLWVIVEDLPRKWLGNSMAVYFGKDVLVGVVYLALAFAWMRRQVRSFRPPFLVPLLLFAGVVLVQMFNPHSPSVFYGLLGFKLYLYYAPLLFVGYALLETEQDLQRLLRFSVALAIVVAVLGITQGVIGLDFLNPREMAPELEQMTRLTRVAPVSKEVVARPSAVFVSDGRFATYVLLTLILALGLATHEFIVHGRRRWFAALGVGTLFVAAVMTGSRGAAVYAVITVLGLSAAALWGAPLRWRGRERIRRAIHGVLLTLALGFLVALIVFPEALGARWAFYWETLSPTSPGYELAHRVRDYPWQNLVKAFQQPNWATGNGTGTASLGTQYVSRYLGVPKLPIGVENGYGVLLLEMGIAGLLTWLLWTFAATVAAWRVVRRLRGTHLFPVAAAIFWFVFLLLFPFTYGGMQPYQNFILNAHFWLLLGVLFRLPGLATEAQYRAWAVARFRTAPAGPAAIAPLAGSARRVRLGHASGEGA